MAAGLHQAAIIAQNPRPLDTRASGADPGGSASPCQGPERPAVDHFAAAAISFSAASRIDLPTCGPYFCIIEPQISCVALP